MGCLQSKDETLRTQSDVSDWESPFVSSQVYRSRSATGGVRLQPFCAEYVSTSSTKSPYKAIHTAETHVFFALWEPINGTQAAAFCKEYCYGIFMDYMKQASISVEDALYNTFNKLDERYLKSQYKDQVKAGVGAQGLICYICLHSRRCYVAKLGSMDCVVTKSYGSGKHASIQASVLTQDSCVADLAAEVTVRADGSNHMDAHRLSDQETGWHGNGYGHSSSATVTPAIGLGCGKVKKLADVYQRSSSNKSITVPPYTNVDSTPEIVDYDIGRNDEHLIVATEGLSQQLSPNDMALLCHHFNLDKTRALRDRYLTPPLQLSNGTSRCGRISADIVPIDESDGPIPDSRDYNLAAMLVRCARQRRGSVKGGDDIAAMVLCLDWPKSLSTAHISVGTYNDHQCVQHKLYRWQLLKLYTAYLAAKRRNVCSKWWSLVSDLAKKQKMSAFLQNYSALHRQKSIESGRIPLGPANGQQANMKKFDAKLPTPRLLDTPTHELY